MLFAELEWQEKVALYTALAGVVGGGIRRGWLMWLSYRSQKRKEGREDQQTEDETWKQMYEQELARGAENRAQYLADLRAARTIHSRDMRDLKVEVTALRNEEKHCREDLTNLRVEVAELKAILQEKGWRKEDTKTHRPLGEPD
jgi:hypothetical protein